MSDAESLGAFLKRHRESRALTLDEVATTTKINKSLLDALEQDDLSKWPSGIFRRSFFRAYVTTIGLDPALLMDDLARLSARPGDRARSRAAAELHRSISSAVRLTLATEESSRWPSRSRVVPAAMDAAVVATLFALALRGGYPALGMLAAILYYCLPSAFGWRTAGAAMFRRMTVEPAPVKPAPLREAQAVRAKQQPATVDSRVVMRPITDSAASRRAG